METCCFVRHEFFDYFTILHSTSVASSCFVCPDHFLTPQSRHLVTPQLKLTEILSMIGRTWSYFWFEGTTVVSFLSTWSKIWHLFRSLKHFFERHSRNLNCLQKKCLNSRNIHNLDVGRLHLLDPWPCWNLTQWRCWSISQRCHQSCRIRWPTSKVINLRFQNLGINLFAILQKLQQSHQGIK
jgi:hypothetical protein